MAVTYQPDSIVKRFRQAHVDAERVVPPTGPESPTIDVEWRFSGDEQQYRIYHADPNTGFNCGWHRDDDHPDLGPVHFQYAQSCADERGHEPAQFSKSVPTEILWSALGDLFEQRLPRLLESR